MANEGFKAVVNGAEIRRVLPASALAATYKAAIFELCEAERVALAWAPARLRARYAALLALDQTLRSIASRNGEPLLRQLRLAWWRDACRSPTAPGHPILALLRDSWPEDREALAVLVDAWEEVALGDKALVDRATAIARPRAQAFAICAGVNPPPLLAAARCWSFMSLAGFASDRSDHEALLAQARETRVEPLPRSLRPVAVLAGLAQRAARRGQPRLLGDRMSPLAALRLGIFGR